MYRKIFIFIILFFFIGCTSQRKENIINNKTKQNKNIDIKPQKGGSVSLSMRVPKTLNPILNEDTTVNNVLKLIFEDLFIIDENMKPVPNLVNNIEFSENSKSAILYIKENIKWEDGNNLTAEDVHFTINAIKSYKQGIYKNTIDNIANCEILDTYTIKVNFNDPTGCQGYDFCFPIIPKHYYKDSLNLISDKNFRPLGNGPFKFNSYRIVKELNLIYNDLYFKKEPYIRNVNVIITSDYDTDIYAFEQEVIDILLSSIMDWNKHNTIRNIDLINVNTNYFDFIGFNFNKPLLNNKNIRSAIAHLINKKEIIEKAYLKKAVITNSPINPSSFLYDKSIKNYEYNTKKSRELFEKEGYKFNEVLKCLQKNIGEVSTNIKFKIIVNEENIERVRIANILKENLQSAGIIIELIVTDYDSYLKMLEKKDFDIFIGGFNLSFKPLMDFAFSSSQINTGQNYFSYNNKDLDNILLSIKNAEKEDTYIKNIKDFQKHIGEDLPIISIAFRENILLIDKNIKVSKSLNLNNIYYDFCNWFFTKKN